MPRPLKVEIEIESKKSLPDVAELKFDGWGDTLLLIEELTTLQSQVGVKPDDKKGKEGSGLLARIHTIKQQLSSIMAVEGLPGLRHNNFVFSDCWVDGRETVDIKALKIELAQEGVDMELLNRCIANATKQGDGYYRRMLVDITKPRGGGWED